MSNSRYGYTDFVSALHVGNNPAVWHFITCPVLDYLFVSEVLFVIETIFMILYTAIDSLTGQTEFVSYLLLVFPLHEQVIY